MPKKKTPKKETRADRNLKELSATLTRALNTPSEFEKSLERSLEDPRFGEELKR